jgi:hypothetical protein
MRLLLDAKDLINVVEHRKPVTIEELDTWLRDTGCTLVYSLANVRALVAPISIDPSQLPRVQLYVEQLERLPHCYICDFSIDLMELRSAVRSFEAGQEYEAIDPYVRRFDFVFPPFANPGKKIYPLWEIVRDLWRACPKLFEPPSWTQPLQGAALSADRKKPRTGRRPVAVAPVEPIIESLVLKMSVTRERAAEIASWIQENPIRCPGLWILRTIGAAMSQNRTYLARKDDILDLSQTLAIPCVDMITLDRTMCDYFSRAKIALGAAGLESSKAYRIFKGLKELMQARL